MYGSENESGTDNAGTSGATNAPWSVRAEFTIRRNDTSSPVETTSRSATIAPITESTGVRMTYSFTPTTCAPIRMVPTSSMAPPGTYGFQRGNLLFTSTPPSRSSLIPVRSHTIPRTAHSVQRHDQPYHHQQQQQQLFPGPSRTNYSDSGYNSEQVSSQSHSSLPSRQPSDKRCKSTYNIVLSSASRDTTIPGPQQQKPQSYLPYPKPWSSYYQTIHQHQQQHQQQFVTAPCCRFSTVPEVCEDCAEAASGVGSPFATHFCTRLSDKATTTTSFGVGKVATATVSRDAASQTTDIEAKHSPVATRRKVRTKAPGALAGSSGRDELKNDNFGRLSRTLASTKSPTPPAEHTISDSSSTTNTRDDNSEKRKRTVHIDVYCTGTDDDPNDEDDVNNNLSSSNSTNSNEEDDDEDDSRTQTTVFESTDVRVTHTQHKSDALPRGFQDEKAFLKRATERRCESFKNAPMRMPSLASSKGYESDDLLSSLYPSQFSSYSRMRDFESSVAWSAASSRSGIAIDEYDSASATSWKDTVSDMESLINSKTSITPCDSFEYADSVDRERIRRMENSAWSRRIAAGRSIKAKNWRSPHVERKHLLQGKMMKDYMEKHPPVGWSSDESSCGASESESAGSASEEVGWSFVSSEENTSVVRGKLTLPPMSGASALVEKTSPSAQVLPSSTTDQETSQAELREVRTTIFRDRIGPFGSTSPSPPPSKLQSRMTSPFTTPQGERTDHIIKASIFGRVVSTFKKPGHHVGPAKNPACSCEHCRRHFEESNARGRSRSLDTAERRNGSRAPSSTN